MLSCGFIFFHEFKKKELHNCKPRKILSTNGIQDYTILLNQHMLWYDIIIISSVVLDTSNEKISVVLVRCRIRNKLLVLSYFTYRCRIRIRIVVNLTICSEKCANLQVKHSILHNRKIQSLEMNQIGESYITQRCRSFRRGPSRGIWGQIRHGDR